MISITWDMLEQVAKIVGPQSAAQQALDEAKSFLDLQGSDGHYRVVNFYKVSGSIVVEKIDCGPEMMGS
jgi:hypothetical protein